MIFLYFFKFLAGSLACLRLLFLRERGEGMIAMITPDETSHFTHQPFLVHVMITSFSICLVALDRLSASPFLN